MDFKLLSDWKKPSAYWLIIAGLAASMAFALMFAAIAEDVAHREPLVVYDRLFEGWLLASVTPAIVSISKAITLGGNAWVIAGLTLILLSWWAWKKEWRLAAILLASVAGGGLLNYWLKLLFHRVRPDMVGALTQTSGFSFPSGHAMISVIFFGFLAYILVKSVSGWAWRAVLILGIGLAPLAIGLSRLVLGVHYPTDVLAGWMVGAAWLAACLTVNATVKQSQKLVLFNKRKIAA
jgi:membrane-associated phospholipid phosphatase